MTRRPVAPGDEPDLVRLVAGAWGPELAHLPDHVDRDALVRMQVRAQEAGYRSAYPDAAFEIVEVDGAVVGRVYTHRSKDELRVIEMTMDPACRGRGLGSQVFRDLQAEAASSGLDVVLDTLATNPARRLFARLGFVLDGERPPHVRYRWTPSEV